MRRKGMSHIEMIASFALFVGFLLFGLYFFNPLNNQRLFDSTLYYATKAIDDNITTHSISYGIALSPSVNAPAVVVPLSRGDVGGYGVYVEDSLGNRVPSAQIAQGVAFDRTDYFFQIRFGDFPYHGDPPQNPLLLTFGNDYTISASEELDLIDETRARQLAEAYRSDYDSLKTRFNIPRRVDFAFMIKLSDADQINATREIPADVESFAQTKRVRLTKEDGSTSFADMTVVVW